MSRNAAGAKLMGYLLLVFAFVAGLMMAAAAFRNGTQAQDALARARMIAMRSAVQDRLIGSRIEIQQLLAEADSDSSYVGSKPAILWVLDLERCHRCLAGVGGWTRLERLGTHDLVLLIIGEPSREVQGMLRTLRRTRITVATRAVVFSHLGPVLENTKMLIDEDGIIVLLIAVTQHLSVRGALRGS